ncbi:MAG: TonB-dependent receptor plug domain-containing protein [Pseudomonadales bacterium]|nr:TonB-dependent receptor plug domain-containing protein [Pseudomonadales bacterium]
MNNKNKIANSTVLILVHFLCIPIAGAQENTSLDSTITYPAVFFTQYDPVNVNDMINRIPGISLAVDGGSGNTNARGLGDSSQILINGKRLAGKENEAANQLSRIPANQVKHIDIIRGTSSDLDVRSTGQLINIVLLEAQSSSSLTVEGVVNNFHDGNYEPAGSVVLSRRSGALSYLLSIEQESRYEFLKSFENSINGDFSPNDTIKLRQRRKQENTTFNTNISYALGNNTQIAMNALYRESDPPVSLVREISNLNFTEPRIRFEREDIPSERDNWEVGGDFQHTFADSGRFKFLFIINDENHDTIRERYTSAQQGIDETKNLFLSTDIRNRERIARTSYTRELATGHNLELGVERAQTILNSSLLLGSNIPGTPSPETGGLVAVPLPNANSEVEEIRYEPFLTHNWQINPSMSLESTLVYETSEIEQSGDVSKSRNFNFLRPKLDYRYNISPSMQLRFSVERFISQLSFADFTAATNSRDEDQDTVAGNPELEQEKSWRYSLNFEYRLPNDTGVINARVFHWDIEDVIGKIDISPSPAQILSANGNIGRGSVSALQLDTSIRLGFLSFPGMLLTTSVLVRAAEVEDPFSGEDRRIPPFDRGNFKIGFRHDQPAIGVNYGLNYQGAFQGNRPIFDIDRVDDINQAETLSLFLETTSFLGATIRFEANNVLDDVMCRNRIRFDGRLSDGIINEIENNCSTRGVHLSLKARKTF